MRADEVTHGLDAARAPRLAALLSACRPRQWAKNLLVIAAPAAGGALAHGDVALRVAAAFVCFCLLASAGYLINDVHDRELDASHPRRGRRPIAAGEVSVPLALATATSLIVVGLTLAFLVSISFGIVAFCYLALTIGYSLLLRELAIADIVAVAACFVLRAIAGGVATGVPASRWFVMVASFGALFLVAAKRYAELRSEETDSVSRPSLHAYTESYLRFVVLLAASVATSAYCLWAFSGHRQDGISWYELTVLPYLLWMLRYGLLVEQGHGEAPEELVLGDGFLMAMSGVWIALFGCAVYVGT